jgi:hypothetical protein
MKDKQTHIVKLDDKQVEFLVKCIDIAQDTQSINPDLTESQLIKQLTNISQAHEDDELSGYELARKYD